ncbi:MAG: hypothetical protein ACI30R_09940 [Sodaliphilus sp.]
MGCGTGIETTTKVTDKDVKKVEDYYAALSVQSSLQIPTDSVASWKVGKRFYVTDNKIALIFSNTFHLSPEELQLQGKYLTFSRIETGGVLDNRAVVTLIFNDGEHEYRYFTNKEIQELSPSFQVPFLIDDDIVKVVASQITGKTLYTRTRLWYDIHTHQMMDSRQYIAVSVDSVSPGDDVLPLNVYFTTLDTHEKAMLRISCGKNVRSRDFDAVFSINNPRETFSEIEEENWQKITNGKVAIGMTKQECRLAKGAPKQIVSIPSHDGLGEYWYYDGGEFLRFEDGILKQFR